MHVCQPNCVFADCLHLQMSKHGCQAHSSCSPVPHLLLRTQQGFAASMPQRFGTLAGFLPAHRPCCISRFLSRLHLVFRWVCCLLTLADARARAWHCKAHSSCSPAQHFQLNTKHLLLSKRHAANGAECTCSAPQAGSVLCRVTCVPVAILSICRLIQSLLQSPPQHALCTPLRAPPLSCTNVQPASCT